MAVAAARPAAFETMQAFVGIETGSEGAAGLARMAALLGARLRALGAGLEQVPASPGPGSKPIGRFEGTGTRTPTPIAHHDTECPAGTPAAHAEDRS